MATVDRQKSSPEKMKQVLSIIPDKPGKFATNQALSVEWIRYSLFLLESIPQVLRYCTYEF